jgi:PAS domain S-box-containing protein
VTDPTTDAATRGRRGNEPPVPDASVRQAPAPHYGAATRYGVAVVLAASAVALTIALAPFVPRTLFVFAFPAVALAALAGGVGPGLLAAVLCVLGVDYYLIPPARAFSPTDPNDLIPLGIFVGVAGLIGTLTQSLHTARGAALAHAAEAEDAAARLQEQALELELANQQLQEQQAELEAQAAELEAQAAELAVQAAAVREANAKLEGALADAVRARGGAEEARRTAEAAEERLQTVFAQAPAAVAVTLGPEHRYALVNPRAAALVGRDDLVGRTYADAFPTFVAQGFAAVLDRVYATGEPFVADEMPVELPQAGGAPRPTWFDLVYQPLRDASGTVVGVLQHAVEVTERVRARQLLERTERRSRFLADLGQALQPLAEPDAVMETAARLLGEQLGADRCAYAEVEADEDTFTITGNYTRGDTISILGRFAFRAFGAEALRLMRANAAYVVDDAAADPRVSPADRAAYEATQIRAVICVPLHKAGRLVAAMAVHQRAPRRWTPDEVDLVVTVVQRCWESLERARAGRDLRDREAALRDAAARLAERTAAAEAARAVAEQERARADAERARAAEANRAKSEFLSTMSHELRTPLNAIAGYAELLALGVRGPVTEAQRQDLERLRRANQHMAGLVEAVLTFARVEAGRVEYRLEEVRLDPLVADLDALLGPQFAARGLAYDHDGCGPETPERPHVVRADAEKVRQILLNLLTNAVKFTDPPGRVALACETDAASGTIRVRVTDTGRGIAADQLERVFEPFVQVDRHRTPGSQQGVGLGLAISRDLARGMGGELTVESIPGVGSTFTLTLPRA